MKKIFPVYFLILLFAMSYGSVHAQSKGSIIGFRTGVSIPFGAYHQKDLDGGSYTQAGFNFSIEGAWFFKQNFGVGILASLNMNPVDVVSLAQSRVQADPFLNELIIRSEPYRIIAVMPGLFASKSLGKKWALSGKLLGGLLYGQTPYQLYKPNYYLLPNTWQEITSAKDWKFSWLAGVGLQYHISSCVDLCFDSDLMYDQLKFDFQTSSGTRTDTKTIAMINLTLGIRIRL